MNARVEQLAEGVTLYCGDCREIMTALPRPNAIVSDPPYGQSHKTNIREKGERARTPGVYASNRTGNGKYKGGLVTVWPETIAGDDTPFDPLHLIDAADIVLLWGSHRFGDRLPPGTTLVWDKVPTGKVRDQGDGEAAWLNAFPPRALRIFRLLWDGVCVGSAARHELASGQKRLHPTQKPEALMAWCIAQARVPTGGTILDPYMGAGSTGVAAVRTGHPFTGIEIEPLYFDTACRRIADALRRPSMFVEQTATARQQVLFEGPEPSADPLPVELEAAK